MTQTILTLLPPGGFSNLVGHYVAALDVGSAYAQEAARACGDPAAACAMLQALGNLEGVWVHESVGGVPTPDAPEDASDVPAWLAWLEAVRIVSLMVLRPLQDRDLERLVRVGGPDSQPRTLKRLLAELLYLQGTLRGQLEG